MHSPQYDHLIFPLIIAALLQEKNPDVHVSGVILLDSISLYEKKYEQLWSDLRKDSGRNIPLRLVKVIPEVARSQLERTQNIFIKRHKKAQKLSQERATVRLFIDGSIETMKELAHQGLNPYKLKRRVDTEVITNATRNPYQSQLNSPVIMVYGEKDIIANPTDILARASEMDFLSPTQSQSSEDNFFKDIDGREKKLKNILPNSPYIRMIVARKNGLHNLTFFRPESVAHATWTLLARWHREQEKGSSGIETC